MTQNKRVERTRLGGVKRRSRGDGLSMPQFLSTLGSMALVILLGLFVLAKGGNWLMDELVFGNGYFTVKRIKVQNDGRIDPKHFREWARIRQGDNLLRLDLKRVKRDLESIPWVAEAGVKRVLPDTVILDVHEREPLATLNLPELLEGGQYQRRLCQIDKTGFISRIPQEYLFSDQGRAYAELPHILPYAHSLLRDGRLANGTQIHAALEFLRVFNRSPMHSLVRLRSIDLSEKNFLRLRTHDQSEVILSLQDFPRQVARWNVVFHQSRLHHKAITYLDLSVSNYLPLRWEDRKPNSQQSDARPGYSSDSSNNV